MTARKGQAWELQRTKHKYVGIKRPQKAISDMREIKNEKLNLLYKFTWQEDKEDNQEEAGMWASKGRYSKSRPRRKEEEEKKGALNSSVLWCFLWGKSYSWCGWAGQTVNMKGTTGAWSSGGEGGRKEGVVWGKEIKVVCVGSLFRAAFCGREVTRRLPLVRGVGWWGKCGFILCLALRIRVTSRVF